MKNAQTKENIPALKREVQLLRSFIIGFAGKDREGEYRPNFVRDILNIVDEKTEHNFRNGSNLPREL